MQAACQLVEIAKASRNSGNRAFVFKELLDRFKRAHYLLFHREHLAFEPVFTHGEDFLFHFVEQVVHLVLFLISPAYALGGGGNDFAQNIFVANDVEIISNVCSGWNESEQAGDERRAAYVFQKMPITQHLGKRDQVDRLPRVPKIDKNVVDRPVCGNVKVFFVNFLDAFRDRFSRGDEHGPEYALLRVDTMRRGPVNILRRTCGRNGNNFFATSRCRTSASAISRFTRLLSCPSGRLSRHLFRFFCLFLLSAEKSSFFWFL